jgi:hypothetical protein
MKLLLSIVISALFFNCESNTSQQIPRTQLIRAQLVSDTFAVDSWQYFLQHLPVKDAPILDYTGRPVNDQSKHIAIINYDVGSTDLQQCADALIRLRSEYLFAQKRYHEIGFHFCSGQFYTWSMYCDGLRPKPRGNAVIWTTVPACEKNHTTLRSYLNIVFDYANTISLCKELQPASAFTVGTVIITPGSPGHTCIIIDEATAPDKSKVYKMAEGYMPAQSVYILSNPYDEKISPWYHLQNGVITTASYRFTSYYLKRFE